MHRLYLNVDRVLTTEANTGLPKRLLYIYIFICMYIYTYIYTAYTHTVLPKRQARPYIFYCIHIHIHIHIIHIHSPTEVANETSETCRQVWEGRGRLTERGGILGGRGKPVLHHL